MSRIIDQIDPTAAVALLQRVSLSPTPPEQRLETACEDCGEPLTIDHPPVASALIVCVQCAKARTQGKRGIVVRRQVAKHQPRLACTPEEFAAAEARRVARQHVTIANLSDAELGGLMRDALASTEAKRQEALADAVAQRQAATEAADAERKEAERAKRSSLVFDGFSCPTKGEPVDIPALDLREVPLGEVAPARMRSPYNKARFRLGLETLDTETTWEALGQVHQEMAQQASEAVQRVPQVVAAVDTKERAKKVAALVLVTGKSKAECEALLDSLA